MLCLIRIVCILNFLYCGPLPFPLNNISLTPNIHPKNPGSATYVIYSFYIDFSYHSLIICNILFLVCEQCSQFVRVLIDFNFKSPSNPSGLSPYPLWAWPTPSLATPSPLGARVTLQRALAALLRPGAARLCLLQCHLLTVSSLCRPTYRVLQIVAVHVIKLARVSEPRPITSPALLARACGCPR